MKRFLATAALLLGLFAIKAIYDTVREPVVRRLSWSANLPDKAPRRIVLLADIHVAGPDMPPTRLRRIVDQVNSLKPDIVMIAGDFVSDKRTATRHFSTSESLQPLEGLDRRAIKIAVPGNHDHWRSIESIERPLTRMGFRVLRNEVIAADGLSIAGLDDDFTGRANLGAVLLALAAADRPVILLSHSPDPFADLPASTGLMLAGHTHCGQIGWPWGGSPATMSKHGDLYACGVASERGNVLVTSAGLGTSILPFRLFTSPELWVIDVVPRRKD